MALKLDGQARFKLNDRVLDPLPPQVAYRFGRHSNQDVVLESGTASRAQFALVYAWSAWGIVHLGGRNSTYFRGVPLAGAEHVRLGERVIAGDDHVDVLELPESPEAAQRPLETQRRCDLDKLIISFQSSKHAMVTLMHGNRSCTVPLGSQLARLLAVAARDPMGEPVFSVEDQFSAINGVEAVAPLSRQDRNQVDMTRSRLEEAWRDILQLYGDRLGVRSRLALFETVRGEGSRFLWRMETMDVTPAPERQAEG